jgi:hypothetical protein
MPSRLFVTLLVLCAAAIASAQAPPSLDPTYGMFSSPYVPPRPKVAVRDAHWIWAAHTAGGQVVYLRRSFDLQQARRRVDCYITADDYFTLYVNGRQVDASHPDPTDGNVWQHVHKVNIGPLLRVGKNALAIRAENAGGPAGVIVWVELGRGRLLLTDGSWRITEQPGEGLAWTQTAFDDATWNPATMITRVASDGPWSGLQGWPGPGGDASPYLAHLPLRAVSVLNIHPSGAQIVGANTLAGDGHTDLTIKEIPPSTAASQPPSLVLDFGKELAGRVVIRSDRPGTVIVSTGESLGEAMFGPYGGPHSLALAPGSPAATPYSAFRYAKLTFPGSGQSSVHLTAVTMDHDYYPVAYRGSFSCSDPLLTKIWYTGAYTAHLCMQEDIWDAPKRDRARWMGDLHVSGDVIDTAFGDKFLMEQTMKRLRSDAQGGRPATALPAGHVNGIPGYSCAWIAGLADFHRHIGDMAYLKSQHDLLVSMLDYLRGELDERGLFANRHGAWCYVDWAPLFNDKNPHSLAATHFFLTKAVREAAFLFREMHDEANASRCDAWAKELAASAYRFLDGNTDTFGDRRQDNAMAIYAGITTPTQTAAIYRRVLAPDSPAWNIVATPYYNNYVISAMSLAGHTQETLTILRRIWGGMLAEGATSCWEGYDPSWEKSNFHAHLQADNGTGYFVSLCHGWSSGATSWLTERLLGIQPTSGGYRTVDITPDLCGLKWAEGSVPTPNGPLHERLERAGAGLRIEIRLPANVVARVAVPGAVVSVNGRVVSSGAGAEGRVTARLRLPGRYVITAH